MHLRRGRNQRFEAKGLTPEEASLQAPIAKLESKQASSFDWDQAKYPVEIRELAKQKKVLAKKIFEIENRLRFGYSEPLHDYKMELVKEDLELSCKMTDILLKSA